MQVLEVLGFLGISVIVMVLMYLCVKYIEK
jgi:hypothetical protein